MSHWLSAIAKHQAISAYRRLSRRRKFVAYRAEITIKIRDAGEVDDLDLESLADKNAVAAYRTPTPDKILEQAELAKAARRAVRTFLDFVDEEKTAAIIRNKVDGITFEALAKRTGRAGKARLEMRISRAYRKMRERVPLDLRRALVHVYRGGDLEYAKKQSKKPK